MAILENWCCSFPEEGLGKESISHIVIADWRIENFLGYKPGWLGSKMELSTNQHVFQQNPRIPKGPCVCRGTSCAKGILYIQQYQLENLSSSQHESMKTKTNRISEHLGQW